MSVTIEAIHALVIEEDVLARVKPELDSGERLLWASTSRPAPPTRWGTVIFMAAWTFGLLAIGIGCVWLAFSMPEANNPFLFIGLGSSAIGLIVSAFLIRALRQRWNGRGSNVKRTYALTDRRAIVWEPVDWAGAIGVSTYMKGSFRSIKRLEYPDGSGDIRIAITGSEDGMVLWPPLFEGVADVRQVEELVRRTLVIIGGEA